VASLVEGYSPNMRLLITRVASASYARVWAAGPGTMTSVVPAEWRRGGSSGIPGARVKRRGRSTATLLLTFVAPDFAKRAARPAHPPYPAEGGGVFTTRLGGERNNPIAAKGRRAPHCQYLRNADLPLYQYYALLCLTSSY
jgi:hypothetical protein